LTDSGKNKPPTLSFVVADRIRRAIEDGEYLPGSRLPPEPELAEMVKVSRPTLRESLRLLESEGLVVRRQRTGTVVTGRPLARNSLERNRGIQEMIDASRRKHGVSNAEIRFMPADANVASALSLKAGAPVVVLERTITSKGAPVIATIDYVDQQIVERASAPLTADIAWYPWLHENCGIDVTYGIASVSATASSDELAQRLEVSADAPLFRIEQVDYTSADEPVLFAIELHAPDAFDITVVRSGPYT
jgi:GntR family transcriptional regulator